MKPDTVIQYQSAGVRERRLLDNSENMIATWTYTTWEGWSRFHHISEERRTMVVSPEGNAAVHYLRANSEKYGNAADLEIPVWDFGLPYTRRYTFDNDGDDSDADELFLSVEHFDGAITSTLGADPITGTRLRSTFVRYDKDELGYGGYPSDAYYRHVNRHLAAQRTVYWDELV
ncbi:MAG: hypothetical protein GY856_44550, partial [bacterium]|nr:hypothetical protein [bacterium]